MLHMHLVDAQSFPVEVGGWLPCCPRIKVGHSTALTPVCPDDRVLEPCWCGCIRALPDLLVG